MKRRSVNSKHPSRGLNVVALGGGTGLSTLLRGLKEYVTRRRDHPAKLRQPIGDLTAIVTVTDDGGSSGRLRRENRVLPPGDIRNCMVALSQDEALLGRLFQYRFHAGHGLIEFALAPGADLGVGGRAARPSFQGYPRAAERRMSTTKPNSPEGSSGESAA